MLSDLLFGPKFTKRSEGIILTRSYVLDIDIIDSIVSLMRRHETELRARSEAAKASATDPGTFSLNPITAEVADFNLQGFGRTIEVDEVAKLLPSDRKKLHIEGVGLSVGFFSGREPAVVGQNGSETYAEEIARMLDAAGRPRVNFYRLVPAIPVVAVLMLVVSWAWYISSAQPALPATCFSIVVVALLSISCVWMGRSITAKFARSFPGHRFREASRSDTRAQLARVKSSIIVAAVSTPAGVLATLAIQAALRIGPFGE